jgi:acyl-CoA dehydrogenase family protein 9
MSDQTPSSFSKSLYFGRIPEEMVIPYPRLRAEEKQAVRALLDKLRVFADKTIDPRKSDDDQQLAPGVLEGAAQLGLCGLSMPTEVGGQGLSMTGYARVMQEVAGYDDSLAVTLGAHQLLGANGIVLYGNDEQKRRLLPDLAAGKKIAAFALTEPEAGSDAASVRMRARPEPDGSFVLEGEKRWITNGAIADVFTVFAQTEVDKAGQKKDRITAFVVERGSGVRSGPAAVTLGVRGAQISSLHFENVRVPAENVLGHVGGGFKVAMGVLHNGRVGLSAACIGAARQVVKLALAHASSRRQFGRPLSEFGLMKGKLALMMSEIFAAESMLYLTTGLIDRQVADTSVESACCKVYCSEMLWRVTNEALQIAAGAGYMKEFPYERMLRDARAHLVFAGTNEILRCFIALTGMQGPGDRLAQLSEFIKWPLKGYGLAIDFVVDKLKTQYYGNESLSTAHSILKREAVLFEDWVPELSKGVEKTLRKHGKDISEMQFVQQRIADITIDLYKMIACIARVTGSIQEKGAPEAEREAKLCRAVCGRASHRIKRNIRRLDENDDELLKAIAQNAIDATQYDFDVVLG